MELNSEIKKDSYAVKFTARQGEAVIGWAYLYLIFQDRHQEPYGLLENVYVMPEFRSQGLGTQLVRAIIEEAKKRNCYKLIGTSKAVNQKAHIFYERLGFKKIGFEFRMDLKHSQPKQED